MNKDGKQEDCRFCGRVIPADAPEGLCPVCLLLPRPKTDSKIAVNSIGSPPPGVAQVNLLFSEFDIVELIGSGGMGSVYRAVQLRLDREVALKILPLSASLDEEATARFEREAVAMAMLDHPRIVSVFDFGETSTTTDGLRFYYFVMEFIDGVPLVDLLEEDQLSCHRAVNIVRQIGEALQYAHDQGVVHRDIKPANVLIEADDLVKIVDFGLAKVRPRGLEDLSLTMTNIAMGTPYYMAPEQSNRTSPVDHRADVFSLGVILYEMLTGRIPRGAWEAPSSMRKEIDSGYDEVVTRAMRSDPNDRFQSVAEFLEEIARITTGRCTKRRSWLVLTILAFGILGFGAYFANDDDKRIPASSTPESEFSESVRKLSGHEDVIIRTLVLKGPPAAGISASWDGSVRIWDLESAGEIRKIKMNRRISDIAVAGEEILVCKIDGNLSAYSLDRGNRLRDYGLVADRVEVLPGEERFLVCVLSSGKIHVFNRLDVAPERSWILPNGGLEGIAILPDGSGFLTFAKGENPLRLWSFDRAEPLLSFNGLESYHGVNAVAVSADSRRVAACPPGNSDGKFLIWDVTTGELVESFEGLGAAGAHSLYFHPQDERYLVASNFSQTISIHDRDEGKRVWSIWEENSVTANMSLAPDGHHAFGGAGYRVVTKMEKIDDYDLRLWRLPSLDQLKSLPK